MAWLPNTPRGDLLPVDERPRFQDNWTFIETELQDDHFFDEGGEIDGHHKRIEMQDVTDAIGSANVTDGHPTTISNSMTGNFYVRTKTATESPDAQQDEAYYMLNDGARNIHSQLGMKAMVTFRTTGGSGATIIQNGGNDWDYEHNISTVVKDDDGKYTISFTNPMSTTRYLVLATAEGNGDSSSSSKFAEVSNGSKAVGSVTIITRVGGGVRSNPISLSVIIIGG